MNENWTNPIGSSTFQGEVKITDINANSTTAGGVVMANGDLTAQWATIAAGTGISVAVNTVAGTITIAQTGTYSGAITGVSLNINSGAMTVDGTGNIVMGIGAGLTIGSVASIDSSGNIIGTSLNVGVSGAISGGAITGSSLNIGTGTLQVGTMTLMADDATNHLVHVHKNTSTGLYELQVDQ